MHLFCFGLGYTALHLISSLDQEDWLFSGTTRSNINLSNVTNYIFDEIVSLPNDVTHILISIPPKDSGDLVIERFAKHLPRLKNLKWIGYLSTTGVYGDYQGAWVDEDSPLNPGNQLAKNRALAEQQWLKLMQDNNLPLQIFRLTGIYGNGGRNPLERILTENVDIIHKPNQYFSRIHVDDIVNILTASMRQSPQGEIFNLADDLPSQPAEVLEFAYKLLSKIPPTPISYEQADLSERAKVFYSESRRVKNDKVKKHFNIKLIYPTYKEGLRAIFDEQDKFTA